MKVWPKHWGKAALRIVLVAFFWPWILLVTSCFVVAPLLRWAFNEED